MAVLALPSSEFGTRRSTQNLRTRKADPMSWSERTDLFLQAFEAWDGPDSGPIAGDPLGFPGYSEALNKARSESGLRESVVTGRGHLRNAAGGEDLPIAVIAFAYEFMSGSLGAAAGERVVRAFDRAMSERLPVIVVVRSGGARIQEGVIALIQMARIADAARRHGNAGLLQVAYLDSPTIGGVFASLVGMSDVIWAAPGATIGYAGPRIVELTTGLPLPPDAHNALTAWNAGNIDAIMNPEDIGPALGTLIRAGLDRPTSTTPSFESARTDATLAAARKRILVTGAIGEVESARDPKRASTGAWLAKLFPTSVGFSGSRGGGGVDEVIFAGIGITTAGTPVAFVALDGSQGDGRPRPAGLRASRRVMALGDRLGLPLLTIIDTPGVDPSDASERAGLPGEISRSLVSLSAYSHPTVSLIVGRADAAGALAFAATDRCFLLDGSYFTAISPEAAGALLERDATKGAQVAPLLKLTGPDLVDLGVIDAVLDAGDVTDALEHAFSTASPGDGRARLDSATRRWLSDTAAT